MCFPDAFLFNPTSSELADVLTLPPPPPLDSPSNSQDAYISTPAQADGVATLSTTVRPLGQSHYCSVRHCWNVISDGYPFKMCIPCHNHHRGYATKRHSKSKCRCEIMAQELQHMCAEEDSRRAKQGLPVSDIHYMVDAPPHLDAFSAYW